MARIRTMVEERKKFQEEEKTNLYKIDLDKLGKNSGTDESKRTGPADKLTKIFDLEKYLSKKKTMMDPFKCSPIL